MYVADRSLRDFSLKSHDAHTPACWSCPVIALKIHHKTVYRFRQPVSLWAHRLILRPRESRDLRLMSHTLAITPASVLTWAHDVFGNAVAMATFAATTDMLVIDSAAVSIAHKTIQATSAVLPGPWPDATAIWSTFCEGGNPQARKQANASGQQGLI
jgi:hypothetical protein